MSPGQRGRRAATRGADHEALANQERLGDGLDGVRLLADRDGKRAQANRATPEPATQGLKDGTIQSVKTAIVDVEQGEGRMCGIEIGHALAMYLCPVTDPSQQSVGDAGCPPRSTGDLGDG